MIHRLLIGILYLEILASYIWYSSFKSWYVQMFPCHGTKLIQCISGHNANKQHFSAKYFTSGLCDVSIRFPCSIQILSNAGSGGRGDQVEHLGLRSRQPPRGSPAVRECPRTDRRETRPAVESGIVMVGGSFHRGIPRRKERNVLCVHNVVHGRFSYQRYPLW